MPETDLPAALAAVDEHFDTFVAELQELCRLRSRRQEPEHMAATAAFLKKSAERWGGTAEVIAWEDSHPYVIAEIGGGERRLLHFNHYDVEVEPTGDESEWISPPYAAEIHDDRLYARGVADDKGALMSRLHAAAAWRLSGQQPPVTSRYIMEGKQWLHSPGLGGFVAAHADRLAADAALWENSWTDGEGRPLLKLAEKGVLYLRLTSTTLTRELTSQNTVLLPSATARLVSALASLVHPDGTPAVEGFADDARVPTGAERALLERMPFDGAFLKQRAGVRAFNGGLSDREAAIAVRTVPTLTIAGIAGGDMRDDVTLGIPATATAKIEIRLVPGQDPQRVLGAVRAHLSKGGFGDLAVEVMATSSPHHTDHTDPFVALVADAARRAYGAEPLVEPYTQWIGNQGALGDVPIVGVGVSRADAGIDGPNEHIRLEDYRMGIKHVVEIMAAMAVAE
ncbi:MULTISPECIES: M20/M25/M40 family metallo-hydrolase [Streptomyces]|uniref:M20/M25/M40 family metallo-hydrolase n=1 Tax=Streptomyces TaxID=1883 RepID=UPI00081B116C|nr:MULTISPECIES: M20/M25/M40 family metallo-hydrolase [Streptomyces]MBT3078054.1 M20/M25/M40 family metallo-hydrolase [Streptomyces sp. COG21]MBT3084898.1 M20/M25/M40 family metallo-hydrolase [Streptomyces sp. COG20]MBT3087039.1 M20/M25/M40 family metallo-hydrolase [Streptomyces sp. CYG21]MBT3097236.1 M20/M25/M40 family metallo-hydrolase [Streptomyces sp. CBG30]MBT3113433.1 M20/M25/M40 family metallo-hydrolase [Streptomyces sp. CYG20]